MQLGILRSLFLRDGDADIAGIFRAIETLLEAAGADFTARELRLFWSIATS
jgi:hypothetical protein